MDADTQCSNSCPVSSNTNAPTAKCGGPGGLVSVYKNFAAFSTLDLVLEVTNLNNATISTTEAEVNDTQYEKRVSTGEVTNSL